ncbi:hypothetical protein A7981_09920 [Methylovorus sp. MM2]|uniref:hypothetical protein n=1 Tax=Methylovorus sp. MM2 TaxID=1848038 RepID=UPI0007DF215E|nr:hypothetical protein [Methylovorus sp. MM2]OAM51773.1 hypothetical protein A7981_09920 [Methylovorus sp. MM2]
MAIYRCSQCNYIAEIEVEKIGSSLACKRCQHSNKVWDTTFFVTKLLEQHFALQQSIKRAQTKIIPKDDPDIGAENILSGISLFNTDLMASDAQHKPIQTWFSKLHIQASPNHKAVDTTGFFDEIANEIGNNYALFNPLLEQICYAQTKNHNGTTLSLSQKTPSEVKTLTAFCRQLYDYSFVGKYFHQKTEKSIRLILQTSPVIRSFFSGAWLEWFAMMQVLILAQEKNIPFSCARNLSITFANNDVNELDVFFLINEKTPICIECKTGEYKSSIEKYRIIKKRLGLQKNQFILCVAGLSDEHAQGMSSMYEITFVNEKGLNTHLRSFI